MANVGKVWAVSEDELQKEIGYLRQLPEYQKSSHLPQEDYEKLLRKMAYWSITRVNAIALGIITVLLFGGVAAFVNALNNVTWFNWSLIKMLLIIVAIYSGLYLLFTIPLNKCKSKLLIQ